MLIITRRVGESIRIITESGAATIVITDVTNGNVKLGVDAPRFMRVERDDMKRRPTETHYPCIKCGQPSWTLDGLCFKCGQESET